MKTSLADVTQHTLKPGYLVSAKVVKLYENGLELSFLGGMRGTVFIDHLNKERINKYKTGEKLQARVISHDIAGKKTSLSLLPSMLALEPHEKKCNVGEIFDDVKVDKIIFGSSFLINLKDGLTGFLHKSNIPKDEESEVEEEDEEEAKTAAPKKDKKKKKKSSKVDIDSDTLLTIGQVIPRVRVKEYNYFDGMPILTMKTDVVNSGALDYNAIKVGDFHTAMIDAVSETKKTVTL